MPTVTSTDGARIAYDRAGDGPAVILIGGALADRSECSPLAEVLATRFSVVNYDRRGRGASSDVRPHALQREVEDLAALIDQVSGPASVYGVSSGGALAIEAAAAGLPIVKLALYEVPYAIDEGMCSGWREYVSQLNQALAAGERSRAVDLFMRIAGSSDADVASAHHAAVWPELVKLAHTLAYDATCLGMGGVPTSVAGVQVPVLVLTGRATKRDSHMQELAPSFFDLAADTLAARLPNAERDTLEEQGHVPSASVLAKRLVRFFEEAGRA